MRATSRLVELNVVVHDNKGNPISGLTRDDFVVKDEGRPQQISLFLEQEEEAPATKPAPLPSNFFTNRGELRSGVPTSITAILFDSLNTTFNDRAYAQNQIIKFLGQVRPEDHVAIYALGRKLEVLYDFTDDASKLVQALARYRGGPPSRIDDPDSQSHDFGFSHLLGDANQLAAEAFTDQRVHATLQAFEVIADHLAGLPGRKNLIWVSGGFPLFVGFHLHALPAPEALRSTGRRAYFEEVERAARALNRANLAVYPVDARGLVGLELTVDTGDLETMSVLAERTGGRASYNTNDIKGSIRRAIDDSRVNYLLGYYPENIKWDGKFRSVRVEVKRSGVEVRSRRGYFALPDQSTDAKERHMELLKTAVSSLDATTIPLEARIETRKAAGARTLTFWMRLDPHSLRFQEKDGRWVDAIDFVYIQRKPDGNVVNVADQTLDLRMVTKTYEKVIRDGLYLTKDLDIQADASELRIIARDANSEALGSLTIPLEKIVPTSGKP